MKKLLPFLFLFPFIAYGVTTVPWVRSGTYEYPNYITDTIGIGLTTPSFASLEVKGTTTTAAGRILALWDSANAPLFTVQNDGQVLLGTTASNPGYKLTLATGQSINLKGGNIRLENGQFLSFGSVSGEGITGSQSANTLTFRTNTTNQAIIDGNGNFGIGTSSPGSLLSIGNSGGINISPTGTSTFGSSANGLNITNGCYAIGGVCIGGSSGSGLTSYDAFTHPAAGQSATTSLMLFNGNASSTQVSAATGFFNRIFATSTTLFSAFGASTTPFAQLSINSVAGSPNLTIGSSTGTQFIVDKNGYVGIGTASPVTPLDVRQPGTGSTAIIYNTGTGANDNTLEFRSGWANLANTSQRLATIVTAPDAFSGSRFILNVTNTSGTLFEAFRVNSSGTFTMSASGSGWIDMPTGVASGIGTGGAGVNPWLANVASINQWFTNSVAGDLAYRNTGGRMFFGNTTSYPAMIIGSDRLGIGPSIGVPTALLQIQPTNATSTPSFIVASTTGATFVQINRDGFLGVGTSTPSTQLDVYTASSTAGTAQTNPFSRLVEMVIGGVYYMVESFDYYGHLITAGPTTTLTSCGTSTVSGNDRNGTIYLNGVAITTCTMNFAKPYVSAPDCVVTDNSVASFAVASSTLSQLVIGISGAGLNSGAVTYQCIGHR